MGIGTEEGRRNDEDMITSGTAVWGQVRNIMGYHTWSMFAYDSLWSDPDRQLEENALTVICNDTP